MRNKHFIFHAYITEMKKLMKSLSHGIPPGELYMQTHTCCISTDFDLGLIFIKTSKCFCFKFTVSSLMQMHYMISSKSIC
jgi:hypothetical protein